MGESIKPVIASNFVILALAIGLQWAGFPSWVNTLLYGLATLVGISTIKLVWFTWKWRLK